jgi:hypothetical protein
MGSSELNPGDLVRIHLKDFPAHGKVGLIVYTGEPRPYLHSVLLEGRIVELPTRTLRDINESR